MRLTSTPLALRGAGLLCALPFAATALHAQIAIPVGTRVPIASTAEFSSKTAKKGDVVPLVVASDVTIDGHVVIAKGTAVKGKVTDARGAGRFGKGGSIELSIDSLQLADGQKVALYPDLHDTATVAAGQDKGNSVVNSIPGGSIAAGFMHKGDDVTFKANAIIPVFTFSYAAVNLPGGTAAPASAPAAPTTSEPTTTTATPTPGATTATLAATDSAGTASAEGAIAPAAIGLFDATHTWARALGALAAHMSATPAVRQAGQSVISGDSALQVKGAALAAQSHTPVPPLDAETQTKLNGLLRALQATPSDKFDATIMQQLYDVQSGFVENIDPEDESPMGKLLMEASPVWKGQMEMVAKLIVPANGAR